MSGFKWATLCAFVTLATTQPARAAITNGDFETGDLTGWTTEADVPPEATLSVQDINGSNQLVFDMQPAPFQMIVEASQTFSVEAPRYLSFDYSGSLTVNDAGRPLYFSAVITDLSTNNFTGILALEQLTAGTLSVPESTYTGATKLAPGNYKIVFSFSDLGGSATPSPQGQVLIDNVQLIVPEPASIASGLVGAGILGLAATRLRKRK